MMAELIISFLAVTDPRGALQAIHSASVVHTPHFVTLTWDASRDTTVTGYNLYYGPSFRNYTNFVRAGSSNWATTSNLVAGATYHFAATSYNAAMLESDYSAELSYTVSVPTNRPSFTKFFVPVRTNITMPPVSNAWEVTITNGVGPPMQLFGPLSYTNWTQ